MKSYAFNYSPQNQTFGQQFLYDGIHDFEYWKETHPTVDYSEYWHGIRDAFVNRNFSIVESLTSDMSKAPISDIANFTSGMNSDLRIAQVVSSKKAWESVRDITNGTGTIISIDLETIGDVLTKHIGLDGKNVLSGYAGITEAGFHIRNYVDGVLQPNSQTFTLPLGLSPSRFNAAQKVYNTYIQSGYNALTEEEQRLIKSLSTYGTSNFNNVFRYEESGPLKGFFVLTEEAEKALPNPYDSNKVLTGLKKLEALYNDSRYNEAKVQKFITNTINNALDADNTAIISANSAFEATVLNDLGIDGKKFMSKSADIVYANTAIARSQGISVYDMQKNAFLSNGVTGNAPASVENSGYAAGLGRPEYHHGGSDAKLQVEIATNKYFTQEKSYADLAIDSADEKYMRTIDYQNSYFYLRNGYLDKNKLDHAVVDGKPTQSHSIRGRFYQIDQEHSNYTMFQKQIPNPDKVGEYLLSDPERIYVLSLVDDEGTRISKQFQTEQEGLTWLTQNSSVMSTNDAKRRFRLRDDHAKATEIEWGRRMYDTLFNPNDIRISDGYEELNGYDGLKKYLELVDKIDDIDNVTDDLLDSYGLKSDYQKQAFKNTYEKIQSERKVLDKITEIIDEQMPNANNTQKTIALRDIRQLFIDQAHNEGYQDFIPKPTSTNKYGIRMITDALGIDVKIGNEYKRINGDSIDSIQRDLGRIFRDATKEDITKSIEELGERKVLDESVAQSIIKNIETNTTPSNQYYSSIFEDIAIALNKVTEPIARYESPIAFFNNLDNKGLTEEQITAIKNKLHGNTLYDTINASLKTSFSVRGKEVTLSELNIGVAQSDIADIIKKAQNITFVNITEKNGKKDFTNIYSTLDEIGESLGYSSDTLGLFKKESSQMDILKEMFFAKDKEYAIAGREDIESFIITPSEYNSSSFVLITNKKNASKVADKLSSNIIEDYIIQKDLKLPGNAQHFLSRQDIADIFDGEASVIELKKFNRTDIANLYSDIFKDNPEIAEAIQTLTGSTNAQMVTINQGKNLEKFAIPGLNVYVDKEGVISGNIRIAGDDFLSTYRIVGKKILDSVEISDFKDANQTISRAQNEVLRNMPSPSSYRGVNGIRVANYNYNDIMHGFYFDGKGVFDTLKLQIKQIAEASNIEHPLYQMMQMVALTSGDLSYENMNYAIKSEQLDNILNSNVFKEFFAKNILVGNVLEDQEISSRISLFSNIKREAFNKNILGMMVDEISLTPEAYSEGIVKSLNALQTASPYLNQVLSETNVEKIIFSFVKPGELIDMGMLNSSMRPTYVQILNAIRFDPKQITLNLGKEIGKLEDTVVGSVSRSKLEQDILDTFGETVIAPSGLKYNQEERMLTTTMKQMSDIELQARYQELDKTIGHSTDEKMQYAYKIFKDEYMSLHEGKMFGAPALLNQEPFISSDVKKIKMNALESIQGNKTARDKIVQEWSALKWDDKVNDWVPDKIIKQGDVLTTINGHQILWEGPDTHLTETNIDELINAGETTVVPYGRMVSDIKVMLQQEKATVHTINIQEVLKREGNIFTDETEALKYFQDIFDELTGYDSTSGMGYRTMFIGNLQSFKHGNNIASDSIFRVIAHEYEKAGQVNTLKDILNGIDYFDGWKFSVKNNRLISNQIGVGGASQGINALYDIIMNSDTTLDKSIQEKLKYMSKNSLVYLEAQRMLVNEIMGSKAMMDERMQQSVRLREIERGIFSPDDSFEDIYLKNLKDSVENGYYTRGSMLDSHKGINDLHALYSAMDEVAEDSINARKMDIFRKNIKEQEKTLVSIKDSLEYYIGAFDVDEYNVLKVNIDDVLKNLPEGGISHKDLQDLIFYQNGKPSNFLKELSGNKDFNGRNIYLDFGTSFKIDGKSFSGVMVPIFDIHTTVDNNIFFTKSQSSVVRFLNVYKENIGTKDGTEKISKAIDALYRSFAREMNPFDKDSLWYKTSGKILLPNSAQSLAQDEVAPLVDAMMTDDILEGVKREHEIRALAANGDLSRVNELDDIISKRKELLSGLKQRILDGDQDDSLFKLTGLSAIGNADKAIEVIDNKKYFANAFEMNLNNFKRHGLDPGIIGYQIFEDTMMYQGPHNKKSLIHFESNTKFDEYLKNTDIQQRIFENLKKEGLEFDDGKQLLRQLNEAITEDMSRGERSEFVTKVYKSMSFLGEEYLRDVGIISREVWRPPVFSAQIPGRIYLNDSVGNNQLRALTGGTTSIINSVDFDGDMYMLSLSLNGNGGLRTLSEDIALRSSYFESLKTNNTIMADLIGKGKVFEKNNLNDISYYHLMELKKFNDAEYVEGLTKWAENNNIKLGVNGVEDLTESQLLTAAHSKELRDVYSRYMSIRGSNISDKDIILASITARIRKENIGSISTPDYKLRDTLLTIKNDALLSETERKEAFDILHELTGLSSNKLLDVSEQKSIDVKHIIDSVKLSETPKWAKGMYLLFDKTGPEKDAGLRMMMDAVQRSTFEFKGSDEEVKKQLDDIFKIITNKNKSRQDLISDLANYTETQQKFVIQFRALYDATELTHAKEIQKYVLRNKNSTTRMVAEELAHIDELFKAGFFEGMSKDSVMDDMIASIIKSATDLRFHGDMNDVYFSIGTLNFNPKAFNQNTDNIGNTIETQAYRIKKINNNSVQFEEVNINTLKGTGVTHTLTGNYKTLNKKIDSLFGEQHFNAYSYLNGHKQNMLESVEKAKISNTLTEIILNTGNGKKKYLSSLDNYDKFYNSINPKKFGKDAWNFISEVLPGNDVDSISRARETLEDYRYYISSKESYAGVEALIRDINNSIADRKDQQGPHITYDNIVKQYILKHTDISELGLQEANAERISLGSFDVKAFDDYIKDFNNSELYDIITSEQKLNESFDVLEQLKKQIIDEKLEMPDGLDAKLSNRQTVINSTISNLESLNKKAISDMQNNIYGLFKDTKQMDIKFRWNNTVNKNSMIVGFGKYLGTEFKNLSIQNAEEILNIQMSSKQLQQMSDLERYAFETTQKLLHEYKDSISKDNVGITKGIVHDSVNKIIEENEQFGHIFDIDFRRRAMNNNSTPKMKKKTIGSFIDSVKDINPKTLKGVGIAVGSLAALGVVNNLLHSDKHKSPVSPEFSNDHNDPGFKNNSVESPQVAPPSKKTIYVDKPSGLQFKVSAKTNNYISDINNAKLIRLSNGGQANVYSQQDTSGVTDNWLANKFAELTN